MHSFATKQKAIGIETSFASVINATFNGIRLIFKQYVESIKICSAPKGKRRRNYYNRYCNAPKILFCDIHNIIELFTYVFVDFSYNNIL